MIELPPRQHGLNHREEKTYCRVCHACCGLEVSIAEDCVVAVRGDRSDPMSHGFICSKGRAAPEQHHGHGRLTQCLKREPSGMHRPIAAEQALSEIASRMGGLIELHGPEAVAVYIGTQANLNPVTPIFASAFAKAIGTYRVFGTMTIDQSAKWIADGRLGSWKAGAQDLASADVWMLVGANPLVTMSAAGGSRIFLLNDPVRSIKAAKARGTRLIVIDPRESDIARLADLHLRPIPGTDVCVIAAICGLIVKNGWYDADFLARYGRGLPELTQALAPFSVERAAAVAQVEPDALRLAARMFAADATTGMCGSGTGLGMCARSNLAEHLVGVLNVLCGRYPRAGERCTGPHVLRPEAQVSEGVNGPSREWEHGPRSVVHGLGQIRGQSMSATLTDEILDAGEKRIRALLCVGGNPAVALPDRARTRRALDALELLVTVDPRMSATARQADYVLAPLLPLERCDHTGMIEGFFQTPYAHYARPLLPAPPGVIDDWYLFWRVCSHLGVPIEFAGQTMNPREAPSREDLLEMLAAGSRVPLSQVKGIEGGRLFASDQRVHPPGPGDPVARFDLIPPDVAEELASAEHDLVPAKPRQFLLTVRRHREVMNSAGIDFASVKRKWRSNPAFLRAEDMAQLAVNEGDLIRITSGRQSIFATARIDDALLQGTVSLAHCWSSNPASDDEASNALVHNENGVEAINRMPVMTGIPVTIERTQDHPEAPQSF